MKIEKFRNWFWKNKVETAEPGEKMLAKAILGTLACDYVTGLLNMDSWRGMTLYEECANYIRSDFFEQICSMEAEEFMKRLNTLAENIEWKPSLEEACGGWAISARKETEEESLTRRMDELKRLAGEGLNRKEIAAAMGVHRNAVGRTVKKYGIVVDPSMKGKGAEKENVAEREKASCGRLLARVRQSELFSLPSGEEGLYVGARKCEGAKFVLVCPEMVAERKGGYVTLVLPEGELQTCMLYNGWLYKHGEVETAKIVEMLSRPRSEENRPNGAEN